MDGETTVETEAATSPFWYQTQPDATVKCLYWASKDFLPNKSCNNVLLKGVQWSPDGSCLLSCSEDRILRLFETPTQLTRGDFSVENVEWVSSLAMGEPEPVYDFAWYPQMCSANPVTCCFLSTAKQQPIHLWDAYTGKIRCSYRPYDHFDEVVPALSLCFSPDGQKIFSGFEKTIRIFDTIRPGRDFSEIKTAPPHTPKDEVQKGLISCLDVHANILAAGSYSKSVGLYDITGNNLCCLLLGQQGGVTQVKFSPDGTYLFTGARKDNEILCWDLRNTMDVVCRFQRVVQTNQRFVFDIDPLGLHLSTGSQDGNLLIYKLATGELVTKAKVHEDSVTSAVFHPYLPCLATCSGQRVFIADMVSENAAAIWLLSHLRVNVPQEMQEGLQEGEQQVPESMEEYSAS